jgi:hypothetical protein
MKTAATIIASAGASKGGATPPTRLCIGPLEVKADAAQVSAFLHATMDVAETSDPGMLPFTFPVRWLARPEIHAAVTRLLSGEENATHLATLLPLHESQAFDYATPLFADVAYHMSVEISMAGETDGKKESEPTRLILRAQIGPDANVVHLRMEMVLRVIAASEGLSDAAKPDAAKPGGAEPAGL